MQKENSMRKIIVSNLVTLDGFFAGPNGEIDWHTVNEENGVVALDYEPEESDTLR
jgi:hypothetical protein